MGIEQMIHDEIVKALKSALEDLKATQVPEFYTPETVAEKLKDVDAGTVRRWCNNGELQGHKFGKFIRIEVSDFIEFCRNRKIKC